MLVWVGQRWRSMHCRASGRSCLDERAAAVCHHSSCDMQGGRRSPLEMMLAALGL